MMVVNMSKLQIHGQYLPEQWIDVLGVVSSVVNTILAISAARFTDSLRGHMKISILISLCLATITYSFLSLVSLQVITLSSFVSLQICISMLFIMGQCLCTICSPLILEFTVEVCYPVSEVVSGGWIFIGYGMGSMTFLLIFLIPNIGTTWLNYILPLSCAVCIPLILGVKENYNRLILDDVLDAKS